jgi:hypothetical protein
MKHDDFRSLLNNSGSGPSAETTKIASRGTLLPRAVAKQGSLKANELQRADAPIFRTREAAKSTTRVEPLRHDVESTPAEIAKLQRALDAKEITYQEYVDQAANINASGSLMEAGKARGLDRNLLARIRAGEDVLAAPAMPTTREPSNDAEQKETVPLDAGVDAEEALEAAFDETLARANEVDEVDATTLPKSRDEVLAELRRKQSMPSQKTSQETSGTATFRAINRKPIGETIEKNGRKIKVIRDETGKIIKKLVKKSKSQRHHEVAESTSQKQQTLPLKPIEAVSPADEEDIFADAGEYDPFATDPTLPIVLPAKGLFEKAENEDKSTAAPASTTQEFLEQNKALLHEAQAVSQSQQRSSGHSSQVPKQGIRAGFGLVLDADDYNDLAQESLTAKEEVEEEEAVALDGSRKNKRRKKTAHANA